MNDSTAPSYGTLTAQQQQSASRLRIPAISGDEDDVNPFVVHPSSAALLFSAANANNKEDVTEATALSTQLTNEQPLTQQQQQDQQQEQQDQQGIADEQDESCTDALCGTVRSLIPVVGLALVVAALCCIVVVGLAQLPWEMDESDAVRDRSSRGVARRWVLLCFDFLPRMILLPVAAALQVALALGAAKYTSVVVRLLLVAALPVAFVGSAIFIALHVATSAELWYYLIDIVLFVVGYAVALVVAVQYAATLRKGGQQVVPAVTTDEKTGEEEGADVVVAATTVENNNDDKPLHNFDLTRVMIFFVIPINVAVTSIGLFDAFFRVKYETSSDSQQLVLRVVVFPLVADPLLAAAEFLTRRARSSGFSALSQALLVAQIGFFVLARFLILIVKDLKLAVLMSVGVLLKDAVLHRLSRQQCYFFWFVASRLARLCGCESKIPPFYQTFFDPGFQVYRSSIIVADLQTDLVSSILIPVMMACFFHVRDVYNFSYASVTENNGTELNAQLLALNGLVSVTQVLILMLVTGFIERKWNGVDIAAAFRSRTHIMSATSIVTFLWCIFFLLGLTRQTPNVLACANNTLCSCAFKKEFSFCGSVTS